MLVINGWKKSKEERETLVPEGEEPRERRWRETERERRKMEGGRGIREKASALIEGDNIDMRVDVD